MAAPQLAAPQPAPQLGSWRRLEPRTWWPDEVRDFTPWLAEDAQLAQLGAALDLDLTAEQIEAPVGPFSADLICRSDALGGRVVIENQLERSDHSHLGQLLTYAAGSEAVAAIWLSPRFAAEHREAVDWLNRRGDGALRLYAVQIELWQIDDSTPAVYFRVVARPPAARRPPPPARPGYTAGERRLFAFWSALREHRQRIGSEAPVGNPRYRNEIEVGLRRGGCRLVAVAARGETSSTWPRDHVRVELRLTGEHAETRYQRLRAQREQIEHGLGQRPAWHAPPGTQQRRLFVARAGDVRDRQAWPALFAWLLAQLAAFDRVFRPLIAELREAERAP